jgi:NAD(P)-dependent dehydrogenase (short-subunit alcohol dehydrogenase family)
VPCRCDVTEEGQVKAMFAAALDVFGRVDAVLNVAGIGAAAPLAEVTAEEYDRVMDVDLRGVFLGTRYGINALLDSGGGVILNWSSTGGINATPFPVSVYSAAKAGVIAFTKAAAVEYGMRGIRAIAICPGFIETEMSGGPGAAQRLPQLVQGTALKRGGQPEEVAELASFLCSQRATYITGAVIPVDGGMTATLA